MTSSRALSTALLALCVVSSPALAESVTDAAHGFSVTLPAGYKAMAPSADPRTVLAFSRGVPGEGKFGLVVVTTLGGVLAEGTPLIHETVESSAREAAAKTGSSITRFEYRKTPWAGFTLDTVVSQSDTGDETLVSFATQVPLAAGAVQVMVAGTAADEAQLAQEHAAVLATLTGPSNWRTDAEKAAEADRQRGQVVGFVLGLVAVPAVALVVLVVAVRRAKARRAQAAKQ